jgi:hypothetical protein
VNRLFILHFSFLILHCLHSFNMSLYTYHESYKYIHVKFSRKITAYDMMDSLLALHGTDGYVVKKDPHSYRCTVYHSGHRINDMSIGWITCIGPGTCREMLQLIQPIVKIMRDCSAGESIPLYQPWQLEEMACRVDLFDRSDFMNTVRFLVGSR